MSAPMPVVNRFRDEPRLVGMECESIPCKSLAQDAKDPLGIKEVLERHHCIISEADKGKSPLETWPHLELKPFIQHVVQENVREAGEITPPCGEPSSFAVDEAHKERQPCLLGLHEPQPQWQSHVLMCSRCPSLL